MPQDRSLMEGFKENIKTIIITETKAKIQQLFYIWIKMKATFNSVVISQLIRPLIVQLTL